jgi:hypothetical protein
LGHNLRIGAGHIVLFTLIDVQIIQFH